MKYFSLNQIPNYLTSSRILLAIIFPFLLSTYHPLIILIAMVTEFLDGFIARLFQWSSRFGEILDPIADKIFFLSVGLTWVFSDKLSWLELILLGSRELGIFLIFLHIWFTGNLHTTEPLKARYLSKITTALQYFALFSILFYQQLLSLLLIATASMGILASVEYFLLLRPKKEAYDGV